MIDLLGTDQFRDDEGFFFLVDVVEEDLVVLEEVVGFCLGGGINKSAAPIGFEGLVLALRQVLGHWCRSGGGGGGGRGRWVYWRQCCGREARLTVTTTVTIAGGGGKPFAVRVCGRETVGCRACR